MACSSTLNLISWKGDAARWLASPSNHLGGGYGCGSQMARFISRKGYGYGGPSSIRIRISRKEDLGRVSHYRKPSIFAGRVGIYRAWPLSTDRIDSGSSLSTDEVEIANSLRVSPWLMLPPERLPATTNNPEDDEMVFKFYSLEENKVLSFNKKAAEFPLPYENAEFVGCSHGWLALLDNPRGDVFLFNPLSGRHLKLPNINTLSLCRTSLLRDGGRATNIILSCAPEDENGKECRAVMLLGGHLAFCWPGHSMEKWTHAGPTGMVCDLRPYRSVVYSPVQKLFFCINSEDQLEAWHLFDNHNGPSVIEIDTAIEKCAAVLHGGRAFDYPWSLIEGYTRSIKFLLFEERSDRLFLVEHLIMDRVGPHGHCHFKEDDTVGFDVYEYDHEDREFN